MRIQFLDIGASTVDDGDGDGDGVRADRMRWENSSIVIF